MGQVAYFITVQCIDLKNLIFFYLFSVPLYSLHSKSEKGLVHDAISKDNSLLVVTPGLARLEAAAWAHSAVSVVH